MKLVSFDIGLRNLAFCVLEGTNRSNLKITHWDLIDVMAESAGHDAPKCFKCKKPANWLKNSEEVYACGTHKPKTGKAPTKTSLTKKSTETLQAEALHNGVVGTTKKELVDRLYTFYTSNIWKKADLIAFEQQPDKRMLCVQAMMHMWFVCAGHKCKGVSATHKLTNIITVQDATTTYKGRKKTGILHAQQLVPLQWKDYMMKHPKKDDLADCFLQGLWVLENERVV